LVHPIAMPVTLAVLGAYLLALAWRERRIPWREVAGVGAAGLVAAPLMIYILVVFSTNPAMAAWAAQNETLSLPPWNYALGYGLVLLLALGGLVVAARRRERSDLFLLAWVVSAAILLYLPTTLQRRFITGFHVPLVILAALGLEQVIWPRVRADRRSLVTGLILAFTALTNLFVPLVTVMGAAQGQHPLAMTDGEAAAWAWLGEHTDWTDTVLAPAELAEFVPAWAGNRVVYGHPFETIDAESKEAEVDHFFSPEATAAERRALLERYGVRYVLVPSSGPNLEPAKVGLTPAWTGQDIALYRVAGSP